MVGLKDDDEPNKGIQPSVTNTNTKFIAELANYPVNGSFQELLTWHLSWGTRPYCDRLHRANNHGWVRSKFAQFVHEEGFPLESAKKNLRNWANEGRLPDNQDDHDAERISRIFKELFGNDPDLSHWADDLQNSLDRGRIELGSRVTGRNVASTAINRGSSLQDAVDQSETLYGEVSKISQGVDNILSILANSEFLKKAIQSGLDKHEIENVIAGAKDNETDVRDLSEESMLLALLNSNHGHLREFAWDCLIHFETVSPNTIGVMTDRALSYGTPYQANAIQEILNCSGTQEDKIDVAESIIDHRNELVRKVAIEFLILQSDQSNMFALNSLMDSSAHVRFVGAKFLTKSLSSTPDVLPTFSNLLFDSDEHVKQIAARGLLKFYVDNGWVHQSQLNYRALAGVLQNDPSMWDSVISAMTDDQAPIDYFRTLLSRIFMSRDWRTRKRILSTIPTQRKIFLENEISKLSSNDEIRTIQAAYRLSCIEYRCDESYAALERERQRKHSNIVISAINMALNSLDGHSIVRVTDPIDEDVDQSKIFPLWEKIVTISNIRGLDIREISKIISFCDRYDADFYVGHIDSRNDLVLICSDSVLDIFALCLPQGTEIIVGASGPEAIEAVSALASYIENDLV